MVMMTNCKIYYNEKSYPFKCSFWDSTIRVTERVERVKSVKTRQAYCTLPIFPNMQHIRLVSLHQHIQPDI